MKHIAIKSVPKTTSMKQTTCPYCGVGCGVDVQLQQNDGFPTPVALEGTPEHPANFGRLCVKGSQLLGTIDQSVRLAQPELYGKAVSWDTATTEVAERFKAIIEKHGPDAVAFYVSGQLLTEDYYVANKLMKGFIGSANIDTNSRLCMSSAVAAHRRAFGADAVPACYEDLELTDVIVFVGSNAAWTHPVLFQRIERAQKLNPDLKLIFIDPRKTASCEQADLHVQIKAGTDVPLFNGLLSYLAEHDCLDRAFIDNSVEGVEAAIEEARSWSIDTVAQICDVDASVIADFYAIFAESPKVISFFSMGVNQSIAGVDKANSIINCHLATGKIGKPGSAPLSITGQPNAMGGREVGGLANLLAAHLDIDNAEHRSLIQEYWQSPRIAEKSGLKAIDLFDAIDEGTVKAVWVMATNPLVSMPNRSKIERAMDKCELVVVSDFVAENDTLSYADIKLPATSWSEKNGTVTNSERTISRQRGFLPPYGESRHDWEIICEVAQKMGYTGFSYTGVHQVFDEYCGLTAFRNEGSRLLDLSGLVGMTLAEYNALSPIQWPVNSANPKGTKRLFENGQFCTANGKARCIPIKYRAPEQSTTEQYPFVLNTGRLRDQWHTMTRTGLNAELSRHTPNAQLAMHPLDAKDLLLEENDYVQLASSVSQGGDVTLPVKFDNGLRRGELFAPIHWSSSVASSASVAHLLTSAKDSLSGQPELKHAAVSLEPVEIAQHVALITRTPIPVAWLNRQTEIWSQSKIAGGFAYIFANTERKTAFGNVVSDLLSDYEELISHRSGNSQQCIALRGGAMHFLLFDGSTRPDLERSWVESLIEADILSDEQVRAAVNGIVNESFKQGRLVCSCFKVGEKAIRKAINEQGCHSVEALGAGLKCGTNCGSCKSELQQILADTKEAQMDALTVEKVF